MRRPVSREVSSCGGSGGGRRVACNCIEVIESGEHAMRGRVSPASTRGYPIEEAVSSLAGSFEMISWDMPLNPTM
jgi:hypothetical protein